MEQFQHEARAMSMSLDSALSKISEQMRHQEPRSPADMLRHQRQLRESVINSTETVIRQGNCAHFYNVFIYFLFCGNCHSPLSGIRAQPFLDFRSHWHSHFRFWALPNLPESHLTDTSEG